MPVVPHDYYYYKTRRLSYCISIHEYISLQRHRADKIVTGGHGWNHPCSYSRLALARRSRFEFQLTCIIYIHYEHTKINVELSFLFILFVKSCVTVLFVPIQKATKIRFVGQYADPTLQKSYTLYLCKELLSIHQFTGAIGNLLGS